MSNDNLSFEDLGVQMGVTNKLEEKQTYIKNFKAQQEQITQQIEDLSKSTAVLIQNYQTNFDNLNESILKFIDALQKRKKEELKNVLAQNGLVLLSKNMDEEQKKRLIEAAIKSLENLLSEAESSLQTYRDSLASDLSPHSIKQIIEQHIESQHSLFDQFRDNLKKMEDYEKGFDYGQSVKDILE
ncbi:MAG: hypothetical protein AAFV25_20230 [Bacteroidota bacterium]